MRRARRVVAAAVLVLLATSACTGTPTPAATPRADTGHPESSPTTQPTSATGRARSAVQDLAHEYYRVSDVVSQDPSDSDALESVASGTELASFQAELKSWARSEWHQTGETVVVEVVVQQLELDEAGGGPSAEVDVCYDVAATDLVDADGVSQIAAGRADRGWERLTITNESFDDRPVDGWRVADRETLEQEPCAGR